jgi:phage N-6-adenine-methyltransferase
MSKLQNWATPQHVFDYFNAHYHYNLDLCAEDWSAKCSDYCSLPGRDAFAENLAGRRVWCNPPYDNIEEWANLCWVGRSGVTAPPDLATLLVPARTDREWYLNFIKGLPGLAEVRVDYIAGRIKFVPPPGWEGQVSPETGKIQRATSCEFPCIAITMGQKVLASRGHFPCYIPRMVRL